MQPKADPLAGGPAFFRSTLAIVGAFGLGYFSPIVMGKKLNDREAT
jgi:hypothetical protein|tara:strand:- start:25 stop:162 length:138 start_codon:yes stop_codon:yes gene_type:complete